MGIEFKDIITKMNDVVKTTEVLIEEDWNYEDTVELLKLCEQYELFWPVIADRIKSSTKISQERYLVYLLNFFHDIIIIIKCSPFQIR